MKKFILGALIIIGQKNYAAIKHHALLSSNPFKAKKINVAVIDTGIDFKHKDLQKNIWVNEGEFGKDALGQDKATNGVDDDMNGFVDDVHGWNFIDNNNDVSDLIGHGTHIAGIIKDEFNAQMTPSTLSPQVRLMALKYYNPEAKDEQNIQNSTRAIEYANRMNMHIINYSGGGNRPYPQERRALLDSQRRQIIVVAAAGNQNSNTDIAKFYPAGYQLQNMITVAAVDQLGELVAFSNFGKGSVDIAAPGKKILSTLPHNSYGYMSGTSQATAFVTGYIALMLSQKEQRTSAQDLVSALKIRGQPKASLVGKTKTQVALIND